MNDAFRKATPDDFDRILCVFKQAIKALRENGIDQWDEVYPDCAVLMEDIRAGGMYVLIRGQEILGVLTANREDYPAYKSGKWTCEADSAAVIHRVCVSPSFQNQGVARKMLLLMEETLLREGFASARLDAFSQNPRALRLYEGLGYKKVGEVPFRKGVFYLYEKPLAGS